MKIKIIVIVVVLNFVLMVSTQAQEQPATPSATPSTCKGVGCSGLSQAELFIKAFGGSEGLRTLNYGLDMEIRNAFYAIDATPVEVEKGRLSPEEGERIIEFHRDHIRNIIERLKYNVMYLAVAGQVSDLPGMRQHLGGLLSIARQDALMGREELAQRAQEEMVKVLTTFSQQFANTCEQQSFPVETALELERQNELMGTGISVMHCANRKFSAELSSQGVNYRFESCSNLSQLTAWDVKISGRVVGKGKGGISLWEAETVYQGWKTGAEGDMEITEEEIEEKEESVKIPNDAGSFAKPNGWASAPIPKSSPRLKKLKFLKLRISTIILTGERGYWGWGHGPWVEAEIKREDDKPCSPLTEDPDFPKPLPNL